MTSRTNGAMAKPAAAKRFELPALEFKFSSLTEGTDIPPPLPSPVEEKVLTPPETPAKAEEERSSKVNGQHSSTSPQSHIMTTTLGGMKRAADDYPASPTFSNRPSSIRRLFSKNLLHSAYAEGEQSVDGDSIRPVSRTSASFVDSKKSKRSSGWFGRLKTSESAGNKRASIILPPPEKKKPKGPPPPMIPEFTELKSSLDVKDDGSLGVDLFKNIK